ncbi:MAG: TIGR02757 family protein [Proteobacteria bacterium]|nr:TIGR02757 family protein [Pseudomonadota bacterium]
MKFKVINGNTLEQMYAEYNRKKFVHPDPLEFLYEYEDLADREIVGLIASSLAYGRVRQILKSVNSILSAIDSPLDCVKTSSKKDLERMFKGFKHRFSTGSEIASLLYGTGRVIEHYGSLGECFAMGLSDEDATVLPALTAFADAISEASKDNCKSLIPRPSRGSACKKLNLFLRWMVRKDDVDPGGWDDIPASKLIVPVDTHMHKIGLTYGLTKRKNADMRTALEITEAFAEYAPKDPVKYDFALTRIGIHRNNRSADSR